MEMKPSRILLCAVCSTLTLSSISAEQGLDPLLPLTYRPHGVETACREIEKIRSETGFRRFMLTGPGFNGVMFAPFAPDLYEQMGREIAEIKQRLKHLDVEISWWCAPTIRYLSDFPSIEDPAGNTSKDNKKCPLDESFAADFTAKICAVAKAHPKFIGIEDDYTLSWGRGLDRNGPCFCKRHLAAFAKRYGKSLTGPEIAAAFQTRTPENLPIRQAFADTIRESLVALGRQVRAAVDEVDPSIRFVICESAGAEKDGNSLVPIARAFAGGTRPAVRPHGAIYGAETTPAAVPGALSHTMWTLEHLPKDVETFYEADTYPHNRFYSSAAQLMAQVAGAMMMGADDSLLYCLQYLDDPLEDRGYAEAFNALKPRLAAVRDFLRTREARLVGVRSVYRAEDVFLTRGFGEGHGKGILKQNAYMLAKFGLPYTTRPDAKGPAILIASIAETMSDEEIRALLAGGVLMDAPAADLLTRRGFGSFLGVDVEMAKERLPIIDETILPAAGCVRKGRHVNAFYILFAGTEGTVSRFAVLKPHEGTEVWSEFTGVGGKPVTPSLTFARNALGGRVAVLSVSLLDNRSSGLYNLRKQEMLRNLFLKLTPDGLPVYALEVPGIWLLASASSDGREMLVMANNLSGDVRNDVELAFGTAWRDARIARLGKDGSKIALGRTAPRWKVPFEMGQMLPEFLLLERETDQ